jgi:hypothetical protein
VSDIDVQRQVDHVLAVLSRAQQVFGAGRAPADPPAFAASPDIEDDLGRGHF